MTSISPILADSIANKEVLFIGVTIVVDSNDSITFPIYPVVEESENVDEINEQEQTKAKAIMLAALEYSRIAGVLKQKAIKQLEDLYE
jgi:hypothetical protein